MRERRCVFQARDVAERAAVAHPGQQHAACVDIPAASHDIEDVDEIGRVGVIAHQGPGRPGGGGRNQDRAVAARIAQPGP